MGLGVISFGGTNRIDLAEERGQWTALLNRIMILRVP
jgi:hypothetical protein